MMNAQKFDLSALLGERSTNIVMIDSGKLTDYRIDNKNQPFQVRDDLEMEELISDIKINGIVNPIIVRPNEDGKTYMILSGHRRKYAAEKIGIGSLPCIIKNCDDKQAQRIMVNSNLLSRQKMLPSEKAWAYRIQQEASGVSAVALATLLQLCPREVQRYIRLTALRPSYLKMVDEGSIQVMVGYQLSFCSHELQDMIIGFFVSHQILKKLKRKDVIRFRQETEVDEDVDLEKLFADKLSGSTHRSLNQRLKSYFPEGTTKKQIENAILDLIEKHSDELVV